MKKFLASIQKKTNEFSLIKQSKEIEIYSQDNLYILFIGHVKNLNLKQLAHAYKTQGIKFLNDLEGSFSLLIHDKDKNIFHIAKDKMGVQPLYFSNAERFIVLGSHLRDFQEIEGLSLDIDPNALANYLQFGFVLQPNTIFKNCHKVQAGECVSFDLSTHTHTKEKYWELESCYETQKVLLDEKDTLDKAHQLLQKSVEKNTLNTNYGLSLSGGYDSSTLAAICQTQSDQKVDTFTIGFYENEINEAPHAKTIAAHLGTNHHEHYFSANDALRLIPKMCTTYDEPFADHASSPTMLTAELLKENNISNLIAGDGGDEVFATAEDVHFFERLEGTPTLLKHLVSKPLNYLPIEKIPYLKNLNNLPKKVNKLKQILEAKDIPQMIQARNTLFLEQELKQQIKGYTQAIQTSFDEINFGKHAQTVDKIIGTYFKTTMIDGELVKSYAAMNHQGIRLSTPFLDTKLIHHMASVPSSLKIKNGIKKYLLKEIAHQYIPKQLIERPKCGFDIPFSAWMKKELKEILYLQINKKRLDKDNIFYTSSILHIRDQFYAGNDVYKYKLWRIFIFQLWYENFTSHNKG